MDDRMTFAIKCSCVRHFAFCLFCLFLPVQFLPSSELVNFYLKLKADHPALISIEDGFDEKDYEGWTRMTEAFAKAHPDFMIVRHPHGTLAEGRDVTAGFVLESLCSVWLSPHCSFFLSLVILLCSGR